MDAPVQKQRGPLWAARTAFVAANVVLLPVLAVSGPAFARLVSWLSWEPSFVGGQLAYDGTLTMEAETGESPVSLSSRSELAAEPESGLHPGDRAAGIGETREPIGGRLAGRGYLDVEGTVGRYSLTGIRARGVRSERGQVGAGPTGGEETRVEQPGASESLSAGGEAGEGSSDRFNWIQDRLKQLGATYFLLETWGNQGGLYRFQCDIAISESGESRRHFEATGVEPLEVMEQVLWQVEEWSHEQGP
jgi:hypothetical protein